MTEYGQESLWRETATADAERARDLVKAGVITEVEGRGWLDAVPELGARGPIVAGRLHIFVWGRKPLGGELGSASRQCGLGT